MRKRDKKLRLTREIEKQRERQKMTDDNRWTYGLSKTMLYRESLMHNASGNVLKWKQQWDAHILFVWKDNVIVKII